MKLHIVGDVVVTLKQGSLDNPNGCVIVSGKDKAGKTREYHYRAAIGQLGDLTGKILARGETVSVVDLTLDIEASKEASSEVV